MNKRKLILILASLLVVCLLCGLVGLVMTQQTQIPDVTGNTQETTGAETTAPEVTVPEVTEPEVTEPEVTEPEVTEPEVTEPEVTEPEVTVPPVTEPELPEGVLKPPVESGTYLVSKPEHLRYMQLYPGQNYALCDDIDMGGMVWEPIENFSGTFNGEIYDTFNYTISNFTIQAAPTDANVGFFRTVSGTVKNVNFQNVTVTCAGTFTGNLGIVAGTAVKALEDVDVKNSTVRMTVCNANVGMLCGKLEGGASECEASGTMEITLAGGTSYIGGGFGYAPCNLTSNTIRTKVSVSGSGTSGAAGGVAGYLGGTAKNSIFSGRFYVTADEIFGAGAVVGQLASGKLQTCHNAAQAVSIAGAANASEYCGIQASGTTVTDCLVRDRNYTEAKLSDAEYAMRLQAVEYMYDMCTVRWSPSKTLNYSACGCGGGSHKQDYYQGKVYFGLPYTHRTGSYERFLHYLDENGKVSPSLKSANFWQVLGNDCADAVYWAWSQFSAQISFVQTNSAICANGTVPVGNYQVANNTATKDTCKLNGKQVMYEAYACVQPGDAMLYGPGHIRLAAEAAYVFRNADGSIDPSKSYILTHEQGAGCSNLDSKRTTCLAYGKYTFYQLFNANYIPITIEAFANGKADEIEVSTTNTDLTKTGLGKGTVSSNYRVNYVTVEIVDADGKVLLDAFGSNSVNDKHVTTYELSQLSSQINAVALTAGKTYTYTVTVCVGSCEVEVQSFQFTA